MESYIKVLVPKSLKHKTEKMKELGLNVSQLVRNFLEAYPMEEKSENVA